MTETNPINPAKPLAEVTGSKPSPERERFLTRLQEVGSTTPFTQGLKETTHHIRIMQKLAWFRGLSADIPTKCTLQRLAPGQVDKLSSKTNTMENLLIEVKQENVIFYSSPKQLQSLMRLNHTILSTLFKCYVEAVLGVPLLPKITRGDSNDCFFQLRRLQVAHSLLCKEGHSMFVLAIR